LNRKALAIESLYSGPAPNAPVQQRRREHHVGELVNGVRQDIGAMLEITEDGRCYVRRIGDADPNRPGDVTVR
jgi:hypothetical protein